MADEMPVVIGFYEEYKESLKYGSQEIFEKGLFAHIPFPHDSLLDSQRYETSSLPPREVPSGFLEFLKHRNLVEVLTTEKLFYNRKSKRFVRFSPPQEEYSRDLLQQL